MKKFNEEYIEIYETIDFPEKEFRYEKRKKREWERNYKWGIITCCVIALLTSLLVVIQRNEPKRNVGFIRIETETDFKNMSGEAISDFRVINKNLYIVTRNQVSFINHTLELGQVYMLNRSSHNLDSIYSINSVNSKIYGESTIYFDNENNLYLHSFQSTNTDIIYTEEDNDVNNLLFTTSDSIIFSSRDSNNLMSLIEVVGNNTKTIYEYPFTSHFEILDSLPTKAVCIQNNYLILIDKQSENHYVVLNLLSHFPDIDSNNFGHQGYIIKDKIYFTVSGTQDGIYCVNLDGFDLKLIYEPEDSSIYIDRVYYDGNNFLLYTTDFSQGVANPNKLYTLDLATGKTKLIAECNYGRAYQLTSDGEYYYAAVIDGIVYGKIR